MMSDADRFDQCRHLRFQHLVRRELAFLLETYKYVFRERGHLSSRFEWAGVFVDVDHEPRGGLFVVYAEGSGPANAARLVGYHGALLNPGGT